MDESTGRVTHRNLNYKEVRILTEQINNSCFRKEKEFLSEVTIGCIESISVYNFELHSMHIFSAV